MIIISCVVIGGVIGFIFAFNKKDKCFLSHDWEYLGDWGTTYQQKRCRRCGKLKIVDQ